MMFVSRRAPHGTVYALETLEAMLLAGAFPLQVSVVFMDDGVFALKAGQQPLAVGMKNFAAAYRALADHGVEELFVEQESLARRGLSPADLMVPVASIDSAALGELMSAQDIILSA